MNKDSKIFVAGHNGMVGSAIVRRLQLEGYSQLILRSSSQLDLRNQWEVSRFFEKQNPDYVFLAAAKVGGINANNTYRGDFLYDNLMIQNNIIHSSYLNNVKKLVFFGSSCIYPKLAPQPLKEEYLLSSYLEYTNEPYAIAKIAGIKLCESYRDQNNCNFVSLMPTNLYGYNDNYHPTNSHVLPSLIRKFHEAKINNFEKVEVWGTGEPMREFLFVDDLADAALMIMKSYNDKQFLNVGFGSDIKIKDLAILIKEIIGFKGEIEFNSSMPDGTQKKLLDSSKILNLGWKPKVDLTLGISLAYKDYLRIANSKS